MVVTLGRLRTTVGGGCVKGVSSRASWACTVSELPTPTYILLPSSCAFLGTGILVPGQILSKISGTSGEALPIYRTWLSKES